jgi:hypothetical protein
VTDKPNLAAEATGSIIREMKWTWRRYFTWALSLANAAGVGLVLFKLTEAGDLRWVALALIGLNALLATYYLIGPTAEHIVAAVQAFRPNRDEKD